MKASALSVARQAVVQWPAAGYRSVMSIDIAIVADDLTGALDTSTPFVLAGRRVAAALHPQALPEAAASGATVVVVNTASRAVSPTEAVARIRDVARLLAGFHPRVVFKKIDSRLKGNVGAEVEALAEGLGYRSAIVAPAIPDQDRPTLNGAVTGRGVAEPLPITPLFAASRISVTIADAASDADLDQIASSGDWTQSLAVGARGLGAAFARRYGPLVAHDTAPTPRTLFAIGSRDQLTERQIALLLDANPGLSVVDAPMGASADVAPGLPALIRSTGNFTGPDLAVSARFAGAVVRNIEALAPDTLVLSGGDTALAVLDRLGCRVVAPDGEAAPGLPSFACRTRAGRTIRCIVKSGGFGSADVLMRLLPAPARA